MEKNFTFIILLFLFSFREQNENLLKAADFQFHEVAHLPSVLNESSGLEVSCESKFWSFNDRNGNAELYEFDTTGNLNRIVELTHANNIDWEDITRDEEGNLYLIDEVLTPDSSRFWSQKTYQIGTSPPNYDKQFIRDYLETLDWDKKPPAPPLPQEIIEKTIARYREIEQVILSL